MKVGVLIPQGWKGEYDGWAADAAWQRTLDLARHAEALGFDSIWAFDHFHTVPVPTDEITFESFSMLTALAMVTERVRLGHMVICTAFRNPALTAKLCATIDVISGGRFEIGIGAGWKEDEWRAYGYGFPPIAERLDVFEEHLEVITRMLAPGRARFEGEHVHVRGAINEPKGLQGHIPVIVGGNGPRRTAGLAIRFADELNFTYIGVEETGRLLTAAKARCEAAGRDPASLAFSLYTRDEDVRPVGTQRIDFLASLAALGLDRVACFPTRWGPTEETQARFAEDCRAAGLELG